MKLGVQLTLSRCPHCQIAQPNLPRFGDVRATNDHNGENPRLWATYQCATCGGVVLVTAPNAVQNSNVSDVWPVPDTVADVIPQRARAFLLQAIASLHAPSGAVMLTASSVDAMLKEKGYKDGTLSARIDAAADAHLITQEMAAWAHEIRLDANDQRHADESAALPSKTDASRVIEFAKALAQFLYVLPARVERGRKS